MFSWLQPLLAWVEFQELLPPPCLSLCPTCALPAPLLVQLLQVWSALSVYARPSAVEPVRMSCWFGLSPTPLTSSPFSVNASCLPIGLPMRACSMVSPCSTPWLAEITWPRKLCHGPLPIRSRALTAPAPCVLRYARHTASPCPAALASAWQCASAPASPPRFAPSPLPTLVTKNDIGCFCAGWGGAGWGGAGCCANSR